MPVFMTQISYLVPVGDSIPIFVVKTSLKTCLQVPVKDSNNLSGASNDSNNLSSASRWLKKLLWSK